MLGYIRNKIFGNQIVSVKTETKVEEAEIIEEIEITMSVPKGIHHPPHYHGYKRGTFANLNQCKVCKMIALYEDMHRVNPCPNCGGGVTEGVFVGIWNSNKQRWLTREKYFEKDIQKFMENQEK